MVDRSPEVSVVGGGVAGLTTAIYLELVGFATRLYTATVPFEGEEDPTLATTYAAASVKPASVTMRDLPRVLETSQDVFSLLADSGALGVRRQPHFVCYERDASDPEYAPAVDGFTRLADCAHHPQRPGAEAVFGWRFTAYFAEMPVYVRRCYELYRALGGVVVERELDRAAIRDLPGEAVVNCTGFWARDLFDDPRPYEAHVGHLAYVDRPLVWGPDDRPFSYNYTPDPDLVPDALVGEVYAYPRTDALVLGGSRIPVEVDPGEAWDGEPDGPTRTVDGLAIPSRIVESNARLLGAYADVDLDAADLSARYGYRPVRDPDGEGVRVERERVDGREIVHNYGYGGAGVTLSWGGAAEAASLVREVVAPDPTAVDVPSEFAVARSVAEYVR